VLALSPREGAIPLIHSGKALLAMAANANSYNWPLQGCYGPHGPRAMDPGIGGHPWPV
jgi:hypothetical protein